MDPEPVPRPLARCKARQAATTCAQAVALLVAARLTLRLARAAAKLLLPGSPGPPAPRQLLDASQDEPDQEALEPQEGLPSAQEQWQVLAEPPPSVPAGHKLICEASFPVSVYTWYERVLSSQTRCLQDFHRSTGQTSFKASGWKASSSGGLQRAFQFTQPKRGVMSVVARCVQQQCLAVYEGGCLVFSTSLEAQGVPYGDCFRVQTFWMVRPVDGAASSCHVSIYMAVPFSKFCIAKSIIVGQSFSDTRQFYTDLLAGLQHSLSSTQLAQPTAAGDQGSTHEAGVAALAIDGPQPRPASSRLPGWRLRGDEPRAGTNLPGGAPSNHKPQPAPPAAALLRAPPRSGPSWALLLLLLLVLLLQLLQLYEGLQLRHDLGLPPSIAGLRLELDTWQGVLPGWPPRLAPQAAAASMRAVTAAGQRVLGGLLHCSAASAVSS